MSTRRNFDRLVNFSDAVVAVAVTLLVLPIVDLGAPRDGETVFDVVSGHGPLLVAYAATFALVIILWTAHHRVLDKFRGYDWVIMTFNTVWLATVALLPWPMSMHEEHPNLDDGVGTLYFGTQGLSVLALTAMAWHGRRHRVLLNEDGRENPPSPFIGAVLSVALFALATVSLVAPNHVTLIGYVLIVVLAVILLLRRRFIQHSHRAEEEATAP